MADNKNTSIKNLPQVEEIKAGDFLVVEADNGTSIIDFEDFVLGDNNTTHGFQISGLQTDITGLSSSIDTLSSSVISDNGTYSTLSAVSLSAESFYSPGTVVQIKNIIVTEIISETTNDFTFLPLLSASITPKFASSKILIQPVFHVGATQSSGTAQYTVGFTAHRGETSGDTKYAANITNLAVADDVVGRSSVRKVSFGVGKQPFGNYDIAVTNWNYLDSPNTTTELTYRFKWHTFQGTVATRYINRASYDADAASTVYFTSTLTLIEIAH
jgi:hypothetical protein